MKISIFSTWQYTLYKLGHQAVKLQYFSLAKLSFRSLMYNNTTVIGLMDQAYFVPRQELLNWIYSVLSLQVNVIEDLGTGAVYCQLLDVGFGQRVPMNKVNWKAKFQYEFIANLKIFQQSLEKLGINKKIDIEKLAKAKYQDNLEMIQWLKRYIELNGNISQEYAAEKRRNNAILHPITQNKKALSTSFKTNILNNSSTMNQSFCSATSKTSKAFRPRVISNKENKLNENFKKPTQNYDKITAKMQEIKKILLSSDDSDLKIEDIYKVVFEKSLNNSQVKIHPMEVEEVESDEELVI